MHLLLYNLFSAAIRFCQVASHVQGLLQIYLKRLYILILNLSKPKESYLLNPVNFNPYRLGYLTGRKPYINCIKPAAKINRVSL